MDPIVITFYAVVCGVLGWAAPKLGGSVMRLGVGAIVGVIAVTVLPLVRAVIGL